MKMSGESKSIKGDQLTTSSLYSWDLQF